MLKLFIPILLLGAFLHPARCAMTEDELKTFLAGEYETKGSQMCTKVNQANWDYETDIANADKGDILLQVTLEAAAFDKTNWETYFHDLNADDYQDAELKRQVNKLRILGDAALDEDKLTLLTQEISTMTNIYSTAKICPYTKQDCNIETEGLSLEPGVEEIFAKSRDWYELSYTWTAWRDASGAKMWETYLSYVIHSNEAAVANGFSDKGEMWRSEYETPNLVEDMDKLWAQVEPLYTELHTYVGHRLKEVYPDFLVIGDDGLLPAHIFGNVWAQEWNNIADVVRPYPDASKVDVNAALVEQGYTVQRMFETANEFYMSMGLVNNEICYDTSHGAMIEKPTDGREVLCHASAWDFCDKTNYRIKMCTEVNFEDLVTIHHEMGHIQYFLQYKDLALTFRDGANPGFHEAIGDTIALSMATPKHLEAIGLLTDYEDNDESSINALMDMALERVAFLPFGLLIDKWRWNVFSGYTTPENMNGGWWDLRKQYQKIKAPVPRTEADFDPGAKMHVAADSKYISYFIAHIVQFQFYKSLCIEAGEYDPNDKTVPLHKCDFYKSTKAGDKFKAGLELGFSRHWSEVLQAMTGETELSAEPLLEYFDPLYQYMKNYNKEHEGGGSDRAIGSICFALVTAIVVRVLSF